MPDICRLRYVGKTPVAAPVLGGGVVEPDCIVDVPGRIITDGVPDGADYFLAEVNGQTRAFPTSVWRNETPTAPATKKKEAGDGDR